MDMIEALEKAPRDSSGVMKSYRSNTVALRGASRVMNEAVEEVAIRIERWSATWISGRFRIARA